MQKKSHGDYVILVVDMLNDFVYGKLKCANAIKIIPKINSVLNISRENKIPIIYCNDAHMPDDDYEFSLWGPHALKDSKGAQIVPDLAPKKNDIVIPKRTYSAFFNTQLEKILNRIFFKKQKKNLVIMGIHTNICAKHTAFDAFVRGYNVIIPEDGVTAFDEKDHKTALKYMKTNYGAKIVTTKKILELLKA